MKNDEGRARTRPMQFGFFILHSAFCIHRVAAVLPSRIPRPDTTGNAANRPSVLSNARSWAASAFTTRAAMIPARMTNRI